MKESCTNSSPVYLAEKKKKEYLRRVDETPVLFFGMWHLLSSKTPKISSISPPIFKCLMGAKFG